MSTGLEVLHTHILTLFVKKAGSFGAALVPRTDSALPTSVSVSFTSAPSAVSTPEIKFFFA